MTHPIQELALASHPATKLINELSAAGYHIVDSSYEARPEQITTDHHGHKFMVDPGGPTILRLKLIYTAQSLLEAQTKAVVSAAQVPAPDSLVAWLHGMQAAIAQGNARSAAFSQLIVFPDKTQWSVTDFKLDTKPRSAYELYLTMQEVHPVSLTVNAQIKTECPTPYAAIDAEITNKIRDHLEGVRLKLELSSATGKDLDRIAEMWGVIRYQYTSPGSPTEESDAALRERVREMCREHGLSEPVTTLPKRATIPVPLTVVEPSPLQAQLRARRGKAFWSGPTPKRIPGDYDPVTGESGKAKAQREYEARKVTTGPTGYPKIDPWSGIHRSTTTIKPLECKPLTRSAIEEAAQKIIDQAMQPSVPFILPPEHPNCRSNVLAKPFGPAEVTPSIIQNDLMGFTNDQSEQWFRDVKVRFDPGIKTMMVELYPLLLFNNQHCHKIIRRQVQEYLDLALPAGVAFAVAFTPDLGC